MFTFLALSLAHAEDKAEEKAEPKFPIVKPSGVIFPRWSLDLTDGSDMYNEFAVDRVYLRTDVQINKRFGARITLDADHMKPVETDTGSFLYDTKYRVFVKHAYLEIKDLGPIKIKAGIIDTPYTAWWDNFWGNRYISESFAKQYKVLATADAGVSVQGAHADGLLDWNVSLLNGEGYDKLEVDAGKAVQARITVDPLAKQKDLDLPITGFVSYQGHPTSGGEPTLVYGGGAGFQIPRLLVWAEVLGESEGGTSGLGYSATANPRLPKYLGLVARYDHWDPDTSADNDGETRILAGLDKDFFDKVSLAVMYERSWVEGAEDSAEHGIVVHGQAGF
jgi:hypothetical protein